MNSCDHVQTSMVPVQAYRSVYVYSQVLIHTHTHARTHTHTHTHTHLSYPIVLLSIKATLHPVRGDETKTAHTQTRTHKHTHTHFLSIHSYSDTHTNTLYPQVHHST